MREVAEGRSANNKHGTLLYVGLLKFSVNAQACVRPAAWDNTKHLGLQLMCYYHARINQIWGGYYSAFTEIVCYYSTGDIIQSRRHATLLQARDMMVDLQGCFVGPSDAIPFVTLLC